MERVVKLEMTQVAKKFLIILLGTLLWYCSESRREIILKGYIFETKTKLPIANVNVILKHQDSLMLSETHFAGAISDSLGYFELKYNGEIDETAMYIGKIGYEALWIKDLNDSKALKKYFLKPDTSEHIDYIPNH